MASLTTFESFLASGASQISVGVFVWSLVLSALFSFIVGRVYIRYGTSISNRKSFAGNFILLATTTTLIITIVKSSLALSLGLVGALSIVRFRSAIKEPEELAYLFLCIAIGLGFGANQILITSISVPLIVVLIIGKKVVSSNVHHENLYLTISGENLDLKDILKILRRNSSSVHLKRFDQSNGKEIEASFVIGFDSFENLERTREQLQKLSPVNNITYLDKSGLY
jgi:uncharacterized membrane protein YhiD involved in acid resistance